MNQGKSKGTFRPGPPANSMPTAFCSIFFERYHERGWWCEVWGEDGQTLHTTELADDRQMAIDEAREWANKNNYILSVKMWSL